MLTRLRWLGLLPSALLIAAAWDAAGPAQDRPAPDDYDKPHDLIVAVDISGSMVQSFRSSKDEKVILPASDPEGIRWDGVQFLIDTARPNDRIALVVFRAEAAVLTTLFDDSGFVKLDTGREKLKALVAEIQAAEGKKADANRGKRFDDLTNDSLHLDTLKTLPAAARLNLWDGTSIYYALEKIGDPKLQLLKRDPDRTASVFLFTDGFEENPFPDGPPKSQEGHEHKYGDYAYIAELEKCKDDQARLSDLVKGYVQPFRDQDVPIFTFGLGKDCSMSFLRLISQWSTPAGTHHPAESNLAESNLDLLDQLRRVAWELRQSWRLEPVPQFNRPKNEDVFHTPAVGAWQDMGILLFDEDAGNGTKRPAHAPTAGVNIRVAGDKQKLIELPALASRSHLFYYLSPESNVPQQIGADASLDFALKRPATGTPAYQPHCYMVMRTKSPLFVYRDPEPGVAKYTPKDLIPLRVDFQPDADGLFRAEDFQVQANLAVMPEAGRERRNWPGAAKNPLPLTLADPTVPSFRYYNGSKDYPDLMLDADPKSAGVKDLVGPYSVDVSITGTGGPLNPLNGAERHLIRRTFEVKDYPAVLKSPGTPPVRLTNADESTLRTAVPVELDMVTDPHTRVADLTVVVDQGPGVPGQKPLDPHKFRVLQGVDMEPGPELHMDGRKGRFYLELPAEEWAALAADDYTGGSVTVTAPWKDKDGKPRQATIPFSVRKERYPLTARSAVVSLDRDGPDEVAANVTVALNSKLDTQETVYFCDDREQRYDSAPRDLAFTSAEGKEIKLRVAGLGNDVKASGGRFAAEAKIALRFKRVGNPASGHYQGKLRLAGPAVQSVEVPVEVIVDQAGVLTAGPDGTWVKDGDKGLKRFHEISLAGLAGTHVKRAFALYSDADKNPVPSRGAVCPLIHEGERDRLAPQAVPGAGERIDLDVPIPLEVEEGVYSSRLTLADPSHTPPLNAEVLVNLQVAHHGVAIKEPGPIQLELPGKGAPTASAKVTLTTPIDKWPMGWWVEQVDPKELENDGNLGEPLPQGVLDVKTMPGPGGPSVLKVGPKDPPKDPVFKERPLDLWIEARCANLAPGLHRGKLRFFAREVYWPEDDPRAANEVGQPFELDVQVVVPGRVVQMLAPADPGAQVGAETVRQVKVSCYGYGCDPDDGAWQPVDAAGKAAGPATPIRGKPVREEDAQIPGLKLNHYTFEFTVRPERAGRNAYRVTWPPFNPDNKAESQVSADLEINARGVITVEPQAASKNENVTVRVTADPTAAGKDEIDVQAVNRRDADKKPIVIALKNQGGGIYTAQQGFDRVGEYDVSLAPGEGVGLALDPATVYVGFELSSPTSLGTIEYGAGSLAGLFGSKQEVSVEDAVRLVNKEGTPCRWRARLRYPTTVAAGRDILNTDLAANFSEHYDESKHLASRLFSAGATPEPEGSGWAVSGTLQDEQTLNLGVQSQLSEPARKELWSGGAIHHPTLGYRNGMVVEVQLEWDGPNGQPVRRTVYAPVIVETGGGYSLWILLAFVPVIGVIAFLIVRRYRKRRARRPLVPDDEDDPDYRASRGKAAKPSRATLAAAETGKAVAPSSDGGDAERPTDADGGGGPGGSDDDLLPEHLRGD